MKIIVSDYTETRINDIIRKVCAEAWENGVDQIEDRDIAEQEVNQATREIISVISEYPERVVEL